MNDQDLHSLLEQLHTEIERNMPLDDKDRELLHHLGMDIRALLAQSEGEEIQAEPMMITRLEESIENFEVTYPDLTMLLNKLLSILSGAGI
jgi:hypothetical protein